MTGEDEIDGLAAEYVLGSLDPSERKEVGERRKTDAALEAAVKAWEKRLGVMADRLPGIEPPAHLFDSILSRISSPSAQIIPISAGRKASAWRRLAVGSTALAACAALVVAWLAFVHPSQPTMLVAELHRASATADEGAQQPSTPVFVVTVDLKAGTATVRPIAARPRPGRSYQLWVLRQGATAPESLGVVSPANTIAVSFPAGRPDALVNATLTVSLEPEGGSPSGSQIGPVMFVGKLTPPKSN